MKTVPIAQILISVIALFFTVSSSAQEPNTTKLLRFPDIHGNQVVFCHGGDLWKVGVKGGTATRLTAHEGQEVFPKFSPDGKFIAFTGQYDGDEQVYVIPSEGGVPRQLTFYPASGPQPPRRGYDNIVYGWSPDGKKVLFRSLRDSNGVTELGALYTVSIDGGLPERLPMPTAGAGDFSPDGKKIVYSPLFRDFRSWKRYEGGWAQYLCIFNLESHVSKTIAYSKRTERDPMWVGNMIYFVSDRTGTLNLFKYDTETEEITQCTQSTGWDVRWASSDGKKSIIYEFGGELVHYDTETGTTTYVPIKVPHDGLAMRPSTYNVSKDIESFSLSPGGKRVAVVARGDLFSVPSEKGIARNLTKTSGVHDREGTWSYDGKTIAFISDKTGEDQIWLVDQSGDEKPVQLTDSFKGQLDNLSWSPDGKFLSISDCDGKLFVIPTETADGWNKGIPLEIARETNGGWPGSSWAPNSDYLAVTLNDPNGFSSIYIWTVKDRSLKRITGEYFNEFSPAWDPDGEYLYYLAAHEFAPQFSSVEWNFAGNRNIGIFAMALRKDVPHPFPMESDEVDFPKNDAKKDDSTAKESKEDEAENKEKEAEEKPKEEKSKKKEPKEIDFDGLADRVARVPVSFDNYSRLRTAGKYLVFVRQGAGFYGRDSARPVTIRLYDVKERKETQLIDGASPNYTLSPDRKKIAFMSGNSIKVCNVDSGSQTQKTVPTSDLSVERVPAEEWEEIFNEAHRKYRDFFYVKNMHGYDWNVIGEQYRKLLPHVAHRSDLNYVLSEMVSELNVGHSYVQGGDFIVPNRIKVALPGARFALDKESNRFKIDKIFKGQNEEPKYRSPLTEIGVEISEGDYVLAIDGKELLGSDNPYRLLRNKSGEVTFTVNDRPELEGARKVVFRPVFSEDSLLYNDFVLDRMRRVEEATDGKIGYMHIPDMGAPGAFEFIKWYYPQIRKEGLIVDARSNGGGNISQWIIIRLNQKLLGTRFGGTRQSPGTYPGTVFHGHAVCLINETSASDGDIFPYYFRKAGIGPLIGKRSWGGVVGISGRGPLIDGGTVTVPLIATNDENGEYIIEGEGVSPDIEVDNDPKSVLEGKDLQLERGIEEVLKQIKEDPRKLPDRKPDPIKTK